MGRWGFFVSFAFFSTFYSQAKIFNSLILMNFSQNLIINRGLSCFLSIWRKYFLMKTQNRIRNFVEQEILFLFSLNSNCSAQMLALFSWLSIDRGTWRLLYDHYRGHEAEENTVHKVKRKSWGGGGRTTNHKQKLHQWFSMLMATNSRASIIASIKLNTTLIIGCYLKCRQK